MNGQETHFKIVDGRLTMSYYDAAMTLRNTALAQHPPHDLTHKRLLLCACCCGCQPCQQVDL